MPLAWLAPLLLPIGAIVASLLAFGGFVALAGVSPLDVYGDMLRGAFGTWFSLQDSLHRAAPLMLTALCTARLGLVVVGGEGALVLGGLGAVVAAHAFAGNSPLLVATVMAVAGFVAGGIWIAIAGGLRVLRGVNETISSLLLTYIALAAFNHLVEGPLRDPASLNKPSTFPSATRT
jgi:simple sugar transport system permease protein